MRNLHAALALTAALAAIVPHSAEATEAVAGRYVPGAYAAPGAGIVPPYPGMYWAESNVFYQGNASGQVPFGNQVIAVGLEATLVQSVFAGLYVPKQDLPGNWTYAFSAAIPVGWSKGTADVLLFERTDEVAGLGDIAVMPLLFGWHNDQGDTFFSAGLNITAPSGRWEQGSLAFIGLNYWTFTPLFGFTHIDATNGIDYSAKLGFDINTPNDDTDYYSGVMAHLDLSITKSITDQLSFGAIAGFLEQIEDDDGTFADNRPDGFKGRSIAVGPLVKYKAKFDETEVDFTLSWAHEVEVKNRTKGDAVFLSASGKF